MSDSTSLEGYEEFLRDIKARIQTAQVQAALSLSREVILLYWHIGREIHERQARYGWGAKVVERLATDLKAAFPGIAGFSRTNLLYMRAFAEAYPEESIVQQLLDNSPLPWGHVIRTMEKVKDADQRAWYLRAAYEHGWSRPFWNIRSTPVCTGGRVRQFPTSPPRCHRLSPTSPSRF